MPSTVIDVGGSSGLNLKYQSYLAKSVIENISKNTTAFGQNVTPVTPACDPDEDDNDDEDDTILNYNRDC